MAKKRLFVPGDATPFPLSRSKLALYLECPRCFWLDRRHGITRPAGYPLSLNLAVDALLKREFDEYRAKGEPHPFLAKTVEGLIPANLPEIAEWRNPFKGIRFFHEPSGFVLYGAVDDVWTFPDGQLVVVDYKATATTKPIGIDDDRRASYRQQLDLYHWIMTGMGLTLSPFAFILWANAKKDAPRFDERLDFLLLLNPYQPTHEWIEPALMAARSCLMADAPPPPSPDCPHCSYRSAVHDVDHVAVA